MSHRLATLLAALVSIIFAGTQSKAVDIYVLTNNSPIGGEQTTNFGRIDSVTGAYASIASLAGDIGNLAWNPSTNDFFVTAGATAATTLRTLSTTGTLSASLGTIGRIVYGMAYRTVDSTLYGYDYFPDDTGRINPANGIWTTLNSTPGISVTFPVGGRYSIMNDTMYFAASSNGAGRFGTMGYTATSAFQQISADALYANMVLANDDTTMYGIFGNGSGGQQRLYTINVGTGALTAGPSISGAGLGTYFHGAAIVPVPEPSTYALGLIASGVMAFEARRRKARRV